MNKILNIFPQLKSDVNFNRVDNVFENSINNILENVEAACLREFKAGFVVLPYFEEKYILNDRNYSKIKIFVKDTLNNLQDRWVLHKVAKKQKIRFHNFSVDDIGYKAGKKGSKDKPNELLSVYDYEGKKIYNIKYSHSWSRIDNNDTDTVLGKIKRLNIWQ